MGCSSKKNVKDMLILNFLHICKKNKKGKYVIIIPEQNLCIGIAGEKLKTPGPYPACHCHLWTPKAKTVSMFLSKLISFHFGRKSVQTFYYYYFFCDDKHFIHRNHSTENEQQL